MGTEIYSYSQEHNILLMALYALLILCGVGFAIYSLAVMPNKECEFDGRLKKVKHLPMGFRLAMQGFPMLLGIALILAGIANGYSSGRYYWGWENGEVLTVSGPVEEVYVRADGDDADIVFRVEGTEFAMEFDSELAAYFEEGSDLTVRYGFVSDEQLIYYIYTNS